ncbi:MAG TPA: acyl-CoA dehydrogenase, partial [Kiloniellaceae bacterium]|nr:acyl-CoA dehydrogenase [Kiloniellaceae bacterium]
MTAVLFIAAVVLFVALFYVGLCYWAWVGAAALLFAAWTVCGVASWFFFAVALLLVAALALLFGLPPFRRALLSKPLMSAVSGLLPAMSETERVAMEAGSVWWDGDLFSGAPDWRKLLDFQPQALSERERAFLDGPVEELCRLADDWQIWQDRDVSPEIWDFLKREGFLGMIIPEAYGGLGFSAIGHSAVVAKVASRSVPVACTLMVPNSLGPAELLLDYGTQEQRDRYLPRLATGEEIPCFALTEPHAGSDDAAPRSRGVVCRGTYDGAEVLGIRLNWEKRYITLAPVATLIGLAFSLEDPDGLLGAESARGITCALIPRDIDGIDIGRRHDPLGVPFANGPILGRDVFIPLDFVIGGAAGVGQGWRMLMDCLAAGRSISLPSLSVGAVELAARTAGAYASVREQFSLPIGRFEGIEEALARIGGHAYFMNATRVLTCGAVDAGEKPAVLSAVAKAYLTAGMRSCLTDAMDIMAGAGICRGPNNILGRGFVAVPLGITVEGANILTRSMIVYGQGAVRCHPYLSQEMAAIAARDDAAFDRALFGHLNFVGRNAARSLLLGLSGGRLAVAPVGGPAARHFRALTRYSAAFALVSDAALGTLGGSLKRREKISGRLADALAWLYLGSAALKRFHDEGCPAGDAKVLAWSLELAIWNIQEALSGVLDNLPNRPVAWLLARLVFPLGRRQRPPSDRLGAAVAEGLLDGGTLRDRLTADIYLPDDDRGLGRLERALERVVAAQPARQALRDALRAGRISRQP